MNHSGNMLKKEQPDIRNVVRSVLSKYDVDAMLVMNPYNMRYLSGYTGGCGYLYLSEHKNLILTDSRYTIQANEEATDFSVVEVSGTDGYINAINALVIEEKVKKLAFEARELSFAEYMKWAEKLNIKNLVPVADDFTNLRQIKKDWELERLKKAEEIGDLAFEKILNVIQPGMTELQIAAHLEFFMKEAGAEGLSFDTIVASGVNSAMPHAVPTQKKVEPGDFITMDFGCIYQGYCSDMTRTIVVGKASEEQKKIYRIVKDAQQAALDMIRAGFKGCEIDKAARDLIAGQGYGKCFGHGLGHSVGLYIHEEPRLSPTCDQVIQAGMIETVEPGIYIKDFGGVRIEDMVCVTQDGYMNFAHSDKNLIEL